MSVNRSGSCIMACMRLSARADYALRAAIELAAHDGHVTAEQLAHAQNIPGKFLETILTHLRRSGLVRSQRGPDGGFWLARPANEISLADIIRAIDGQLLTDSPQAWILRFPDGRGQIGKTGTISVTSPADGSLPSSPSTTTSVVSG